MASHNNNDVPASRADNNNNNDAAAERERQSQARWAEIQATAQAQPLTSAVHPVASLAALYDDDANGTHFGAGVAYLQNDYASLRVVRGDGNCYYRAFLYQLAAQLAKPEHIISEGPRILDWLTTVSWPHVIGAGGYSEMAVEAFYDSLVEVLTDVVSQKTTPDAWHTLLNEEGAASDYCTWYLRVLTATHLKADAVRFLPFLEEQHVDIHQYCQRHVEPMGKECEMVSVLALAEAFGVRVTVEYLDGHALVVGPQGNNQLARHVFGPPDAPLQLTFLYRPGHYDILYPKATT
jgi:ubiquitin thioesterase protein OTUB1